MNNQIRVLVVDDEPRICRLILDVLVQEGYMVEVSFSGADALQLISKYNYHLLITDLEMPGIDGLELIKKVKKRVICQNKPKSILSLIVLPILFLKDWF